MKKIKTSFEDYYPFNILKDIQIDEEEIRKCSYDSIISAIKTLTEREELALQLRYEKELTYEACGNEMGLGKERARQIILTSLQKLKHPDRIRIMKPCPYEEYEELLNRNNELEYIIKEVDPAAKVNITLVENMNLSERSCICLKRAGIKTVQDILDYIDKYGNLLHIKNLGKKSMFEIYDKLSNLGIELDNDKDIR